MTFIKNRKKIGISQMKLSLISGVGRNRISQHECNYIVLNENELEKINKVLSEFKGMKNKVISNRGSEK